MRIVWICYDELNLILFLFYFIFFPAHATPLAADLFFFLKTSFLSLLVSHQTQSDQHVLCVNKNYLFDIFLQVKAEKFKICFDTIFRNLIFFFIFFLI
jgi:hypothetical protein